MEIGKKLKDLRNQCGLTQEELADRAELSKGFISQLEHDVTSPSISTLADILQCLGSSLSEFFAAPLEEKVVYTYDEYFEKEDDDLHNLIEWIIPNAQKNMMEPIRLTIKPGGRTYPDNPHEGEEFGYVLKGKIDIYIGNRIYRAEAGESFYYKPDKTHYIKTAGDDEAMLIWISAPPSF